MFQQTTVKLKLMNIAKIVTTNQYLEELFNWKNNEIKEDINIITADVKNLYPSLKRTL